VLPISISRRLNTTISVPPRTAWCLRKLSRTRRFTLFLSTARLRCFFETASPRRGLARPFPQKSTVKHRSADRLGCRNTRRKSAGVKSLIDLGKRVSICTTAAEAFLRRKTRPAFSAPRVNHFATIASRHARTKAVSSGPLQITRLKCSFHC